MLGIKAQGPGRGSSRAAGVQSGDSPYPGSMASLELGLEEKDPLWPRMSSLIPLPKEGLAGPPRREANISRPLHFYRVERREGCHRSRAEGKDTGAGTRRPGFKSKCTTTHQELF